MSVINWRNSMMLGKAMPMNKPRPPPILLINVNISVLGIWVMFSVLKSIKENLKSVKTLSDSPII